MADNLEIVSTAVSTHSTHEQSLLDLPQRIKYKSRKVPSMVVWPWARLAVVLAARFHSLFVALLHRRIVLCFEGKVRRRDVASFSRAYPEWHRVLVGPKAHSLAREFHLLGVAQWSKCCYIPIGDFLKAGRRGN